MQSIQVCFVLNPCVVSGEGPDDVRILLFSVVIGVDKVLRFMY
jgi:hypothetical protein